jgi:hypothetical protein
MLDDSLKSQIRCLLEAAYAPIREKRLRFSKLTDEQILAERQSKVPSLSALPESVASALAAESEAAYLHRVRKLNDPKLVDAHIEREADALLPLVLEHRAETGEEGELSEAELHQIQLKRTFLQIRQGQDQFGKAIIEAKTPERRELLQRVYDTIVADLGDLESRRGELTHETLQESSKNISERWSQLAQWIQDKDS